MPRVSRSNPPAAAGAQGRTSGSSSGTPTPVPVEAPVQNAPAEASVSKECPSQTRAKTTHKIQWLFHVGDIVSGVGTVVSTSLGSDDAPHVDEEGCDDGTDGAIHDAGVAVFPCARGGRGVHIHSMVPGWNCALLMRTSCVLHGSVMPDEGGLAGFACRHLDMMRVVTYPLKRIETLLARLACDHEAVSQLYEHSDAWVRNRMRAHAL